MPTETKVLLRGGDDGSGGGLTGEHELCALSSDEPTEVIVLVKNEGDNEMSTEQTVGVSKSSDPSLSDEKLPSNVPSGSSAQPMPVMIDESSSPAKKMPVPALELQGKLLSGNICEVGRNEKASAQKGRNGCSYTTLGFTEALFASGGGSEDGQFGANSVSACDGNNDALPATTKWARSDIENESGPVKKRPKKKACSCKECPNKAISGGVCMSHGAEKLLLTREQSRSEGSQVDPKENEKMNKAIEAVKMNRNKKPAAGKVTLPRGVTVRPSGKWQAQLYYAGKSRYIGVFESREDACYAYEVARQVLVTCNDPKDDEVDANINLARKAAFAGVGGNVAKNKSTNVVIKGGLCVRHGKAACFMSVNSAPRPYSGHMSEKGPAKKRSKKYRYECSVDECTNKPIRGGVCWRHGAKNTAKRCSSGGCTNYAQRGGVCVRHGANNLMKKA